MTADLRPESRAWIEVRLDAVRSNAAVLRTFLGPTRGLMAVVKADAYGHGLLPVARAALEGGVVWLGVATVAEGVALRSADVAAPIALLCAPAPQEAEAVVAFHLTPMVGDQATLGALAQAAQSAPLSPSDPFAVHLEIDTGMGRSGARPEEAVILWRSALQAGLRVTGLTTHFADADGEDEAFTRHQQETFRAARAALEGAGAEFDLIHVSNSAAMLRFDSFDGNLVRPGLALYGIRPPFPASCSALEGGREGSGLQPALSLKARVAMVRDLPAGHPISYGATCRLKRPSRVATALIGYGDGYPRRLSNRGWMLLHGRRAPILGRVCMDQTVVDVTDIPQAAPGDEAVCIGRQGDAQITVEQLAALVETTEHEVTTCLTSRLPRLNLHADL